LDNVTKNGINFIVPAPAAEDSVVPDAGLHSVHFRVLPQPGAEVLRRECLTEAADIVTLAFDGKKRGLPDCARLDWAAMHTEFTERQKVVLKDRFHGLDIELGRQIHDRKILLRKGYDASVRR
jgi:hypothetical protein